MKLIMSLRNLQIKNFLKSFLGISFFFIFLFVAAGTFKYLQGWVYYAISLFGLLVNFFIIKNNPELMNERTKGGVNIQIWDKKILRLLLIMTIFSYIIAGLDSGRFHWTSLFDYWIIFLGSILTIIGQVIFTVAKYQNNFFSSVARIQTERNHQVCDTGLYKFVRHPGYLGLIISWLGFPLVMGSLFSFIPVFFSVILLFARTFFEDKMLKRELLGYTEYAHKIRYKIIPLVW